ncbi:TetR family transcriptional regulator [Streptomonospora salina]|uniref:AcrR family transcriptional regulator n=1 Tax=Streptomonospora salina TaxID=104205 RepID=A0A841EIY6_9ACTN|nr:TetR family transcriptional regulator [Streptomonospora salina]MBB6000320.1 AcrR family transcriptional regulator [Streptomonospora salina]
MGLRERKKAATRRTLQRAAVRLAVEHGSENVTVDDITTAADVSKRTFFNYFSSKDEAIVGDGPPRPDQEAREVFVAQGPTGDLLDDLKVFLLSPLAGPGSDDEAPSQRLADIRERKRLVQQEPQLTPRIMATFAGIERYVGDSVAERLGEDPDDIRPQIVASLGITAMRFSMRRLYTHSGDDGSAGSRDDTAELRMLFDQAFDALRRTFHPAA